MFVKKFKKKKAKTKNRKKKLTRGLFATENYCSVSPAPAKTSQNVIKTTTVLIMKHNNDVCRDVICIEIFIIEYTPAASKVLNNFFLFHYCDNSVGTRSNTEHVRDDNTNSGTVNWRNFCLFRWICLKSNFKCIVFRTDREWYFEIFLCILCVQISSADLLSYVMTMHLIPPCQRPCSGASSR